MATVPLKTKRKMRMRRNERKNQMTAGIPTEVKLNLFTLRVVSRAL